MEVPWINGNLTEAIKEDKNFADKCSDIASDIKGQNVKLTTLVEKLGTVLTDIDPELRARGTHILSQVLQNLPANFLLESELNFISTFFCDRLKDHHTVIPAVLQGILAIAQMVNFPRDAAIRILIVMFQQVSCQTLTIADRKCIYQIIQAFIHSSTEELKSLGPDFVYGFISAIDGERDSRNLMLVFQMLPKFLHTFSLGHLREEMFEVIACYFPIDFHPASNDPTAVSRDDLAAALAPCITAIPQFAEFCYPLLLEKMDSSLKLAKMDSFHVLVIGCHVFTIEHTQPFLLELWRAIQQEVLPGSDKEVREAALTALKAVIHMLSAAAVDRDEAKQFPRMIKYVMTGALDSLRDVELSLFLPSARLLLTVAQASPAACEHVIKQVVPILLKQYYAQSGTGFRVVLLQTLTGFLAVCEELQVTPSGNPDLCPTWADIPTLYLSAAQHTDAAIRKDGLHGLAVSAQSLTSSHREMLYELLCKQVKEEEFDPVRNEVLFCLKQLSKYYPNEVMEAIVLSKLQVQKESESMNPGNSPELFRCLDALCEIATTEPFTTCIVPHILSYITQSFSQDKCTVGLRCLRKLAESPEGGSKIHKFLYLKCGAVSQLVSWWMQGLRDGSHPDIFQNNDLIQITAKILNIIMTSQTNGVQDDVVSEFVPKFLNSAVCAEGDTKFRPLDYASPSEHTRVVVLLEALLGSLRQDVKIPSCHELVIALCGLAIHSSHDVTQMSAGRLVANLINKAKNDEPLTRLLNEVSLEVQAAVKGRDTTTEEKLNATQLLGWVTKALVMRGHEEGDVWTEHLLNLFTNELVGIKAAQGFKLIMEQNEDYLSMSNYCNIRVLYKQKFFQIAPKLVESFRGASETVQANYLIALAHLLQGVPSEILLMDLPEIVPLLVESLQQQEVILLLSTLETLRSLLETKQVALEEHMQTFIPRILYLTHFQNCMKVRIKSLQCVHNFCQYSTPLLLPYKSKVVHELGLCLDDPKRLVRQEAVRARNRWFVVGSPGVANSS